MPEEMRPLTVLSVLPDAHGRTREMVECPFCQAEVMTFKWSRSGSGKRCDCGAVLYRTQAYKQAD